MHKYAAAHNKTIKNILPTMGNEFITLIKETSIVSFIGATDLYKTFNDIGSNTYEFMVPYLVMALIYIVEDDKNIREIVSEIARIFQA